MVVTVGPMLRCELLLMLCAVVAGFCGDGILDVGEQCDDGNMIEGDGCTCNGTKCPIVYMGIARDHWFASCVEEGWVCELNDLNQPMTCRYNVGSCVMCSGQMHDSVSNSELLHAVFTK